MITTKEQTGKEVYGQKAPALDIIARDGANPMVSAFRYKATSVRSAVKPSAESVRGSLSTLTLPEKERDVHKVPPPHSTFEWEAIFSRAAPAKLLTTMITTNDETGKEVYGQKTPVLDVRARNGDNPMVSAFRYKAASVRSAAKKSAASVRGSLSTITLPEIEQMVRDTLKQCSEVQSQNVHRKVFENNNKRRSLCRHKINVKEKDRTIKMRDRRNLKAVKLSLEPQMFKSVASNFVPDLKMGIVDEDKSFLKGLVSDLLSGIKPLSEGVKVVHEFPSFSGIFSGMPSLSSVWEFVKNSWNEVSLRSVNFFVMVSMIFTKYYEKFKNNAIDGIFDFVITIVDVMLPAIVGVTDGLCAFLGFAEEKFHEYLEAIKCFFKYTVTDENELQAQSLEMDAYMIIVGFCTVAASGFDVSTNTLVSAVKNILKYDNKSVINYTLSSIFSSIAYVCRYFGEATDIEYFKTIGLDMPEEYNQMLVWERKSNRIKMRDPDVKWEMHEIRLMSEFLTRMMEKRDKARSRREPIRRLNEYSVLIDTVTKLRSEANDMVTVTGSMRKEPLSLAIISGPGLGKSTMAHTIAAYFNGETLQGERREAFLREMSSEIYVKAFSSPYSDNYRNNNVAFLDDFDQRKEVPGGESSTSATIVDWINVHPCQLDAAKLELKGMLYFNSQLLIATSNTMKLDAGSFPAVKHVSAVARRFHLVYKLERSTLAANLPFHSYVSAHEGKNICELLDEYYVLTPWDWTEGTASGPNRNFSGLVSELMEMHNERTHIYENVLKPLTEGAGNGRLDVNPNRVVQQPIRPPEVNRARNGDAAARRLDRVNNRNWAVGARNLVAQMESESKSTDNFHFSKLSASEYLSQYEQADDYADLVKDIAAAGNTLAAGYCANVSKMVEDMFPQVWSKCLDHSKEVVLPEDSTSFLWGDLPDMYEMHRLLKMDFINLSQNGLSEEKPKLQSLFLIWRMLDKDYFVNMIMYLLNKLKFSEESFEDDSWIYECPMDHAGYPSHQGVWIVIELFHKECAVQPIDDKVKIYMQRSLPLVDFSWLKYINHSVLRKDSELIDLAMEKPSEDRNFYYTTKAFMENTKRYTALGMGSGAYFKNMFNASFFKKLALFAGTAATVFLAFKYLFPFSPAIDLGSQTGQSVKNLPGKNVKPKEIAKLRAERLIALKTKAHKDVHQRVLDRSNGSTLEAQFNVDDRSLNYSAVNGIKEQVVANTIAFSWGIKTPTQGHFVVIRGNLMVGCGHYKHHLEVQQRTNKVVWGRIANSDPLNEDSYFPIDLEVLNLDVATPSGKDGNDICFYTLCVLNEYNGSKFSRGKFKDLSKHLLSEEDYLLQFDKSKRSKIPMHIFSSSKYDFSRNKLKIAKEFMIYADKTNNTVHYGDHSVTQALVGPYECVSGDCGHPALIHTRLKKQVAFVGIHVAGNKNTGNPYGVVGTFSLDDFLEYEQFKLEVIPQMNKITPPHWVDRDPSDLVDFYKDKGIPVSAPRFNNASSLSVDPDFLESFGDERSGNVVVKLKPFLNSDGVKVDPLYEAQKKYGDCKTDIPSDLISLASFMLENKVVRETIRVQEDERLLTFDECIEGRFEHEGSVTKDINGLAANTSPGWPWTNVSTNKSFILKDGKVVKGEWYDKLKLCVDAHLDALRKGEKVNWTMTDNLKDESRPEGKAARLISGAPVDQVVAIRMYFAAFIAAVIHNRILNGIAVGLNPYKEFDWIVRLFGDGPIGDGDIKNFDGSISEELYLAFGKAVNRWYRENSSSWKTEDDVIRLNMIKELSNAHHLSKGIDRGLQFAQVYEHQCSGCVLTAVANSYICMLMNSCVLIKLWLTRNSDKPFEEMDWRDYNLVDKDLIEDSTFVVYGDDHIVRFPESLKEVKQREFSEAFGYFGIVHTPADKTAELSEVTRTITDTSFLKRSFEQLNGKWVGALEKTSILKSLEFTKKNTTLEDKHQVVNTALMESVAHGYHYYKNINTKLVEYCKLKQIRPALLQWSVMDSDLRWSYDKLATYSYEDCADFIAFC